MKSKFAVIDIEMKISDNGLVNAYEIKQHGQIILQFNNSHMSMIFLLNKLFPEQREHYINPLKEWNTKEKEGITK